MLSAAHQKDRDMKRPYIDMWSWLNEFAQRAYAMNDQPRIRLMTIHEIAFNQRETNPQQALGLCLEGLTQAEHLNELWLAMTFECRVVEMMMLSLARNEEAVDLATKLVTKVSQQAYINFPMRAWAFINLIIAYFELDALSYSDEIQAMIETLETRIPIDLDIHQRLYYFRARLWLGLREDGKAMTDALIHMDMSIQNDFRASYGYELLTHLNYLRHDDRNALDYAHLTEDKSLVSDHKVALTNSYYWQALFLALQGQTEAAHRLFVLGVAAAQSLNLPHDLSLLHGKCRYYEVKGDYEASLAVWDDQIRSMDQNTSKRQSYFYVFLHRCFVLRQLGRLTEADIVQTRQAALRLRKPDKYLPYIDTLHDGKLEIPRY